MIFGEAPEAGDGPPHDSYDVLKSPVPPTPYIVAMLNDNLENPYEILWFDYRYYPDAEKIWNLTVQWMPQSGSSPSMITLSWNHSEFVGCEYVSIIFCTETGTPLTNMLVNTTYTFSCLAYIPQNFKIMCLGNRPPITIYDTVTVAEDSSNNQNNVLANDLDPDNDPLTITTVTQPPHGLTSTNATLSVRNSPPTLLISGPANGSTNTDYAYAFGASDPEHDDISYRVDWGDGTSFQTGTVPSGQYVGLSYRWNSSGTYTITVIASDGSLITVSETDIAIKETIVPENIWILGLALLAIIALLAILLHSKKAKNTN